MAQAVTPADATLAGFLHSIVLSVVDAYDKVMPLLSDSSKPVAAKFQGHHKEHADALAKQAGGAAATAPNRALTLVLTARLQTVADERGALMFASDLESQVSETYAFALTTLASPSVIHLMTTTLTIVTGHAAVLASSAGIAVTAVFPDGATEGSSVGDGSDRKLGFDPASFPAS